jgi:hypothetical protein|eukprot:COSAG03_NODE_4524_length_1522_cov_23.754041_2_plen_65_part_00
MNKGSCGSYLLHRFPLSLSLSPPFCVCVCLCVCVCVCVCVVCVSECVYVSGKAGMAQAEEPSHP